MEKFRLGLELMHITAKLIHFPICHCKMNSFGDLALYIGDGRAHTLNAVASGKMPWSLLHVSLSEP